MTVRARRKPTRPRGHWPRNAHRIRVLMMTDAVGGVWNVSLDLAAGLRPHRIDVILAVLGPAPSPAQARAAAEAGVHVEHAPYALEWTADPWDDVRAAAEWLAQLELRFGCDLVHLNGYSYAQYAFRGPKVVVGHSCLSSWWQAVRATALPATWERYQREVSAGLAAAHHLVAPTVWMASELRRHYGAGPEISVIHNGRSSRQFMPAAKRPVIFMAGRIWDEAKNLRALSRISREISWPIEVAGPLAVPGQDGGSGTDRKLGGETAYDVSGVELLGPLAVPELARAYGAASIYALPARYEPFGLTVLEAALSGCALVLGDIPSLRELWGDAAIFVNPADDGALARALSNLINWPTERADLGRRARSRARRYSRDRMLAAYARLYGRMLAWPTSRRSTVTSEVACAS
ncbi:MAG TPA: glycosyltransferase family 4 protein [Polyangia bacterium]